VWLLHAEGWWHALGVFAGSEGPTRAQLDPLWTTVLWQGACWWLNQAKLGPKQHVTAKKQGCCRG
jgi:hypothetical protein